MVEYRSFGSSLYISEFCSCETASGWKLKEMCTDFDVPESYRAESERAF